MPYKNILAGTPKIHDGHPEAYMKENGSAFEMSYEYILNSPFASEIPLNLYD